MSTQPRLDVFSVIGPLCELGRLDPKSGLRLPTRLTTLLRRTVAAMPYMASNTLMTVAPPPRREPATGYAIALIALFRAYAALEPPDVAHGVERIGHCLNDLAVAAGALPPLPIDRAVIIEDALTWRAAEFRYRRSECERAALADGHVALALEGVVPASHFAAQAAGLVAQHAERVHDLDRAVHYATIALEWERSPRGPLLNHVADCVSILTEAGQFQRALELGAPALLRHDVFDNADIESRFPPIAWTVNAVQIGGELAGACCELGAHDDALTYAGDALWRAIRRWGDGSGMANACQMVLGDCLIRASRFADAIAMIRPVYEARLRHADQEPKEYVIAGIRFAVALGQLQQIDEARTVSTLAETVAQLRLAPDDELVRDAQSTRRHFEGCA